MLAQQAGCSDPVSMNLPSVASSESVVSFLDGLAGPVVGAHLVSATVTGRLDDVVRVVTADGRELMLFASEWFPDVALPAVGVTVVGVEMSLGSMEGLSVTHPEVVRLACESVVPECWGGQLRVMDVARVAGSHSKVVVASTEQGVDPVMVAVGKKANRVRRLRELLGGERVDVVAWHHDPLLYTRNALAPAGVDRVVRADDGVLVAYVPAGQMASAVGSEGHNARLASQLVGDVVRVEQAG